MNELTRTNENLNQVKTAEYRIGKVGIIVEFKKLGFDFSNEYTEDKFKQYMDWPLYSHGYRGDIKGLVTYIFACIKLKDSDQ